MSTNTTNFGLVKPAPNDPTDQDIWGTELNGDLDGIDSLVKTAINWMPSTQTASFTVAAPTSGSVSTGGAKTLYLCNATSAAIVVTLPAAASYSGMTVAFKKTDSSANTVTVQANGTELIDAANTNVLATQYAYVVIASDGTKWNIVGLLQQAPTGFLLAANNLSDVSSLPTSLTNLGFASLLANPGYQKFPGGMIMQWGSFSNSAASFSLAFPTACLSILCSTDNINGYQGSVSPYSTLNQYGFAGSIIGRTGYYFAIGY